MNHLRAAVLAGSALAAVSVSACVTKDDGMGDAIETRLAAPKTLGGFSVPEGSTYDAVHDRYLISNTGAFGPDNDGYISALNPDGSVQAQRWVTSSDSQDLANPLGMATHDGVLYVADSPYVRRFNLETAAPLPPTLVEGAQVLNDLDVAADGTVYVTDMGSEDAETWKVMAITPDGAVTTFAQGETLGRPNGLDVGPDGRIYLAPIAVAEIVVLDADGAVAETIALPGPSNDGIVALEDSVIVSQPFGGLILRAHADGTIETLTDAATTGASISYDPTRKRIIIPQLQENAVSFLDLE